MGKRKAEAPLVQVAREVASALEAIETLTSRSSKVELTSSSELARAAELLAEAEARHRDFVTHFGALVTAIDDLRQRQNASATALSQNETLLLARRASHDALERRFELLADAASSMTAALASDHAAGNGNAKDEGVPELERRAHAIRQQLASLLEKIDVALA